MKFSTICEKIKSGEFSIDNCGHKTNDLKGNLLRRYHRAVENAAGANDGKWKGKAENIDLRMRAYYQKDLDWEYSVNTKGGEPEYVFGNEEHCFCCGETLFYTFNGNGLSLNVRYNNDKKIENPTGADINLFGGTGSFEIYNCEYSDLTPLSVDIEVSDKLAFANWFPCHDADSPEGDKYIGDFDLCSVRGRRGVAKWKAENQNIAYTQTDSCGGTSIWMNKGRTHGYITKGYIGEDDEETTSLEFLKDYEKVGQTDVAVWRVEMADSAKVDIDKVKERWRIDGDYPHAAVVKVPTGKWAMTTHYDVRHSLSDGILAEIRFCGDIREFPQNP